MPRVTPEALLSVFTWSCTVRGMTASALPKRMSTLPSAPRWNSWPPADSERLSVAETGSFSGQATPYFPSSPSPSRAVTRRNSSQLHGFSGVGIRTPDLFSHFASAIRTRGSWRKGTP